MGVIEATRFEYCTRFWSSSDLSLQNPNVPIKKKVSTIFRRELKAATTRPSRLSLNPFSKQTNQQLSANWLAEKRHQLIHCASEYFKFSYNSTERSHSSSKSFARSSSILALITAPGFKASTLGCTCEHLNPLVPPVRQQFHSPWKSYNEQPCTFVTCHLCCINQPVSGAGFFLRISFEVTRGCSRDKKYRHT